MGWSTRSPVDHHIATHATHIIELNIGGSVHISLALPDHLLLRGHYHYRAVKPEVEVFQEGGNSYTCMAFYCVLPSSSCIVYNGGVSSPMVMLSCAVCRYWGNPLRLTGLIASVAAGSLHISAWHSSPPGRQVSGSAQTPVSSSSVILGVTCNVKGSESPSWDTDVPSRCPPQHTHT